MPLMGDLKIVPQGDREIVMTRTFNAPRRLVFEAMTRPELVRRWLLGAEGWTMQICDMDLRVGGAYRWVWRKEKTGEEMGISGVYREIVPYERIVNTEVFDPAWYEGEMLYTTLFEDRGAMTAFTAILRYIDSRARDTVLSSGMEEGVRMSYDWLENLLETLQQGQS